MQGNDLAEYDSNTENVDDLKRVIGIPTTWTSTDFLEGREWWLRTKGQNAGGNLETFLETYPFENYEIIRGHVAFNKFNRRKDTTRRVGVLKAVIRICTKSPLYDDEYNKFAKQIKSVNQCVLRLYVIKVCTMPCMCPMILQLICFNRRRIFNQRVSSARPRIHT